MRLQRMWIHVKRDFRRTSFLLATASGLIMYIITLLGNPQHNGFYFHYLPEIFAIYFMGVWAKEVGFTKRIIIAVFVFANLSMLLVFQSFYAIPIGLILSFPVVWGYYIEGKFGGK